MSSGWEAGNFTERELSYQLLVSNLLCPFFVLGG